MSGAWVTEHLRADEMQRRDARSRELASGMTHQVISDRMWDLLRDEERQEREALDTRTIESKVLSELEDGYGMTLDGLVWATQCERGQVSAALSRLRRKGDVSRSRVHSVSTWNRV